jgi:hypothetical protein
MKPIFNESIHLPDLTASSNAEAINVHLSFFLDKTGLQEMSNTSQAWQIHTNKILSMLSFIHVTEHISTAWASSQRSFINLNHPLLCRSSLAQYHEPRPHMLSVVAPLVRGRLSSEQAMHPPVSGTPT